MYSQFFDLLTQWSSIYELTVLDSAVCNHIDRPNWLRFLSFTDHINHDLISCKSDHFVWASLRNLKSIFLHTDAISDKITQANKITHLKTHLNFQLTNKMKFYDRLCYLDISDSSVLSESKMIELFQSLPDCLSTMNISKYNGSVSVDTLKHLVQSCPNLTSFNCNECSFSSADSVAVIASGCPQLTSLSIAARLTRNSVPIDDACLSVIASRCPSLTLLDLSNHSDVTDRGLLEVAEQCPLLQTLALTNCSDVTDKSVCVFTERCMWLKHLYLGGVDLTDTSLHSLAAHCKSRLQTLSLCDCDEVTDSGVCAVVASCTQLLSLNLQGCSAVSDQSILTLSVHCSRLTDLNVRECTHICDYSLGEVVDKCPDLLTLSTDTEQNTTSLMFKIMKGMRSITLTTTHSEQSSTTKQNNNTEPNITLQRQFKRRHIRPSVVYRIDEQSTLTPQILRTVAHLCPDLQEIHFNGLTDIRLAYIRAIVEHCTQLQIVKIDSAYSLPASTICLIADTCTHLTTLHVTDCLDSLDDSHVVRVVKTRGDTLTSLRLTSCGELSEEVLEAVRECGGGKLTDLVLNDLL